MYTLEGPVGRSITVPETVQENGPTFATSELPEAIDYYHRHGYFVIRDLVSPEVCDQLRHAWDTTVKPYKGHIYRQTTANPEKNHINEHGFVMNPILNLQDLRTPRFESLKNPAMKTYASPAIQELLRLVFGEDGKLIQSMYFEGNPTTWAHQDTYYLDSEKLGTMIGAWFALEDMDAGCGRFYVVPDSHSIDMAKNGGELDYAFHHQQYKDLVRQILEEAGSEVRAPLLRKGDVLFWNGKTIHGSLTTTRPQCSRSSLTAHYIPRSHRMLQFQSRFKPMKIRQIEGMDMHCPKDMNRFSSRVILRIETTFPTMFRAAKKLAIKLMVG